MNKILRVSIWLSLASAIAPIAAGAQELEKGGVFIIEKKCNHGDPICAEKEMSVPLVVIPTPASTTRNLNTSTAQKTQKHSARPHEVSAPQLRTEQTVNFTEADPIEGKRLSPDDMGSIRGMDKREKIRLSTNSMCQLSQEITDQEGFDRELCYAGNPATRANIQVGAHQVIASSLGRNGAEARVSGAVQIPIKNDKWEGHDKSLNFVVGGAADLSSSGKPGNGRLEKAGVELAILPNQDADVHKTVAYRATYSSDPAKREKFSAIAGFAAQFGNSASPTTLNPMVPYQAGFTARHTVAIEGGAADYELPLKNVVTALVHLNIEEAYRFCQTLDSKQRNLVCAGVLASLGIGSDVSAGATVSVSYARQVANGTAGKQYLYVEPSISGETVGSIGSVGGANAERGNVLRAGVNAGIAF